LTGDCSIQAQFISEINKYHVSVKENPLTPEEY
jgi:hypothetical protein